MVAFLKHKVMSCSSTDSSRDFPARAVSDGVRASTQLARTNDLGLEEMKWHKVLKNGLKTTI